MQAIGNTAANILGNQRGAAGELRALRHIQVRLIQRQWLDQLGVVPQNGVYLAGGLLISVHARLDDRQVRAELECMPRRHRRAHAIRPCLIVTGGNHAAMVRRPANSQRFTGECGVVAHFYGGIETIAIDMNDLALGHRGEQWKDPTRGQLVSHPAHIAARTLPPKCIYPFNQFQPLNRAGTHALPAL
ncbi:hypothetical protein D9M71_452100 [compost metagenome]